MNETLARRKPIWLLGTLVLLLGAFLLWGPDSDPRNSPTDPAPKGIGEASAPASESLENFEPAQAPSDPEPEGTTPSGPTQRSEVEGSALLGRVEDELGGPISGATLRWVAPTKVDLAWEPGWQADDWGNLARSETETTSVADGSFRFDEEPQIEGLIGSAIWATAPGYEAACLLRGLGEQGAPVIVLSRSQAIRVRVEDGQGAPVVGALVEQFGLTPADAPVEVDGALERQRLRRLLRREARTDREGFALLGAFPGEQVLRASLAESISSPWRGPATELVVLKLADSFEVAGTVEYPDWSHLNYEGERRMLIGTQQGNLFRGLATLRNVKAGAWGPVRLPLIQGVTYSAKLEGSPIIPVTQRFEAPPAGSRQNLDFRTELGSNVVICGEDENGDLVPDVTATVWWEKDGVRESITRRAAAGTPYANPYSVPPGELSFSAVAPGYASAMGSPFRVPERESTAQVVKLQKAGKLRGQVMHDGKPVECFYLLDSVEYNNPRSLAIL